MDTLVVFTTQSCPKCKVLKMKLEAKGVTYTECQSIDKMRELGILSVPAIGIPNGNNDPTIMTNFQEINRWLDTI